MANLTFIEKQLMEDVFQMRGGYVLDFSNREFESFMNDVIAESISNKYPGLSKAKMMRRFWDEYPEDIVGKCVLLAIQYMRQNGLVTDFNLIKVNELYHWANKKIGRNINVRTAKTQKNIPKQILYRSLRQNLLNIDKLDNNQKKGYAFESFLNGLFESVGLDPRSSYRTDNDQIDGSFIINNKTILLEAKYCITPPTKDDIILFQNKIERKSPFVRGLFITLSEIPQLVIDYFKESSTRIVVMTVQELYLMCDQEVDLKYIIERKFRYLDETGCIFRHFNYLL